MHLIKWKLILKGALQFCWRIWNQSMSSTQKPDNWDKMSLLMLEKILSSIRKELISSKISSSLNSICIIIKLYTIHTKLTKICNTFILEKKGRRKDQECKFIISHNRKSIDKFTFSKTQEMAVLIFHFRIWRCKAERNS